MNRKTWILFAIIIILAIGLAGVRWFIMRQNGLSHNSVINDEGVYPSPEKTLPLDNKNNLSVYFRTNNGYFYHKSKNNWKSVYLKGVNMGLTEGTTDLADPDVDYDTYIDWFKKIADMNSNTIKVFTIMPPQFYDAFYDYNTNSDKTLYLLQGIWFNEDMMYNYDNAFDDDDAILKALKKAEIETADIIHGSSDYTDYGNIKGAVYNKDISSYLAGYIIGLEWEPGFVNRTNGIMERAGFAGKYLITDKEATPFESFLCEAGEELIAYESEKYSFQTPVAFLNWQTTDTISHDNEPFKEEDMVSVDTENIKSTKEYFPGMFAAVDVYPYYPEFMNYQPEYQKNGSDGAEAYKLYLQDLKRQYSVPVIIAEFGLPTSRGVAHESISGLSQGGIDEIKQGEYIVSMAKAIAREGYAGSMIFSWQDEWFKQTWNTIKYSPDDAKKRTPNVQSAEQSYGILAMEAGNGKTCMVDGKTEDWMNVKSITENSVGSISTMYDEAYFYIKIETKKKFGKDKLFVPIRINGIGSDKSQKHNITFSENTDFLLVIDGKNETRLLCDAYENPFYFRYSFLYESDPEKTDYNMKNSSNFTRINQFLSNEIVLPRTKKTFESKYYESGLLRYGITDPDDKNYNSLSDFYEKDGCIEVRIPWYLLNVMNSTEGVCLNDFNNDGDIIFSHFTDIKIGIGEENGETIKLEKTEYKTSMKSEYHTRLKKSYGIIKEELSNFMNFD